MVAALANAEVRLAHRTAQGNKRANIVHHVMQNGYLVIETTHAEKWVVSLNCRDEHE